MNFHLTQKMSKVKHLYIDFTGLNGWRSCPRKFSYEYILNKTGEKSPSLIAGQAIHKFLELYHSGKEVETARAEMNVLLAKSQLVHIEPSEQYSIPFLLELMNQYTIEYPNRDSSWKTEKTEARYERKLTDRVTYVGNIDAFGTMLDGKPVVVDHKTTKSLNDAWFSEAKVSAQFTGYIWLGQEHRPELDTIIVNGIQTFHYKRPPKDGGEYKFVRHESYRSEEEISEWKEETIADCTRIIEDLERNFFTTRKPNACRDFNSNCLFYTVCSSPASIRDDLLTVNYSKNEWPSVRVEWE